MYYTYWRENRKWKIEDSQKTFMEIFDLSCPVLDPILQIFQFQYRYHYQCSWTYWNCIGRIGSNTQTEALKTIGKFFRKSLI